MRLKVDLIGHQEQELRKYISESFLFNHLALKLIIDYYQSTAYTVNGTFGVKVWLCENEFLKIDVITTKKNEI